MTTITRLEAQIPINIFLEKKLINVLTTKIINAIIIL